ncbi:class I SAM-dependent DNA methyltransferase [Pedobacter heparinus]|uniref:Methyltransferase type 11 n=1 Tax=Pedobacter heparinus (strain ATCC 13125 / DSM 2366 / CIP 104194 / JCM 7457 / NBRC 12017 / NCIMB 9290 / NRRL B-14731 / HIM 762-3) TaxID=485917 RepID=C6XVL2_PEDHD|nr:methyltransferase domain-containing protein [Pedobacter heparinus]ACU06087.1 Methyltransferase type 11 [Pedobacter heparinus DSM 2366]
MIQSKKELEKWYDSNDPWKYGADTEDIKRKKILLTELPDREYETVLDIGCGNGFITQDLPGNLILGVDLSENAIKYACENNKATHIFFEQQNIFELYHTEKTFDLIVVTGVLYPQYIGASSNLIFVIIDRLLNKNGILVSVHINDWYNCRFPYDLFREHIYPYKEYLHRLEVYQK